MRYLTWPSRALLRLSAISFRRLLWHSHPFGWTARNHGITTFQFGMIMRTKSQMIFAGYLIGLLLPRAAWSEDLASSTISRLREDISFLAADEQQGRDVGSEGIARAGEFIAQRFLELGLSTDAFDGTPYQDFTIPGPSQLGAEANNQLSFLGPVLLPEKLSTEDSDAEGSKSEPVWQPLIGENFQPLSLGSSGRFEGQVVFAGYGISAPDLNYDDYAGVDVTGKVVIVLRKEPRQQDDASPFDGRRSSQYAFFSSKELNAAMHKAAALILVNDSLTVANNGDQLLDVTGGGRAVSRSQVPTFFCTRELIDPLVSVGTGKTLAELEQAIDGDLQPRSQVLEGITCQGETLIEQSQIPVRNVVGVLPGRGELAEQYVVIGAHYDHVGMGGQGSLAPGTVAIHNGADDNASGTTAMLEVARRMAQDESENRRTLIFMAFTGEEKGLLGSRHYVRNPRWPLEDTVAMVNMDMVGRLTDNKLTIFGTGTAERFDALVDTLNESAGFVLDKQAAGLGPSDHSSFYEAQIPVFHFFTGLHNDYHRPSDDIEKVNYEGMARVTGMVTELVAGLSTQPERPRYMKTTARADVGRRRGNRPARPVLGIQLDTGAAKVTIASVPPGPSADAGLQAGDVITRIGENEVADLPALRRVMSEFKPGQKVKVLVRRGNEEVSVEVMLGRG